MSTEIQKKIDEIGSQLKLNILHGERVATNQLPKNYHVLFNGSSEAAKNFASQLGSAVDRQVYTIHLPTLVSKYIGETEKNLDMAFTAAEQKNWILLFDEADALFGKRTEVKDAHDKYANQDMARLLDRISNYNGLVILATDNNNEPTDPHLLNGFNTILHFPPKGQ